MSKNRGFNKRPYFASQKESEFFEKTPKRVIFQLLRDCAVQLASFDHDGYSEKWEEETEIWLDEARSRESVAV